MAGLTPKQNAFVAAYLASLNATQAAIEAGYSEAGATVTGAKLLANPKVKRLVAEAMERRARRVEVKADDVLRELIRIMSVDIVGAFTEDGKFKKLSEIPEDVRRAIVSVKSKEIFEWEDKERVYVGDLVEVKFADKMKAIELAMKHLGLLTDKVKIEGTVTLEQLVVASIREDEG
jgi:phage terminase small subunit